MSKKNKSFHDYPFMINILRDKGMIIDDERIAIELLQSVGYYGLVNKYKSEFYLSDKNEYKQNIHLTDLYYYHRVEDQLRNILFQSIIRFEQRFKESMAYILSKKFGTDQKDYLNPYNYRNKNKAKSIITFINKAVQKCKDDPTNYYKREYDDIPPWILLSNLTLGQSRMLFSLFNSNLTKYVVFTLIPVNGEKDEGLEDVIFDKLINYDTYKNHSDEEIEKIEKNDEFILIELIRNIVSIIYQFRNNLAHGNRLIHFHSETNLKINGLRLFASKNVFSDDEYYNSGLCYNDLFSLMVSLMITLDKYDAIFLLDQLDSWEISNTSTKETRKQFAQFIKSCELPNNFVDRLRRIRIEKTRKQARSEFHDAWND